MKIEKRFLPPQKNQGPAEQQAKLKQAAKMYEQHFIREMVKAMRSTVKPSGLIKQNFAEKIFREQLDGEYVQNWTEGGGVGLADLIYNQIQDRFFNKAPAGLQSPKGPVPLQQNGGPEFHMLETPGLPDSSQYLFKNKDSGFEVRSPWSGKVTNAFAMNKSESEQNVVEIDHDNGLFSRLVIDGPISAGLKGVNVEAGQKLGFTQSKGASLAWQVTKKV